MTERQLPSITVAVACDGKTLWEEGFGWADREARVAAKEHTVYSLASISKSFTATALMTLVEKKRIDLDRPVAEIP
jgi:CubicO group peptidase (beta-lactamase class C family)